eukprot:scaffold25827_cov178-Skeletonema_dohrnii-CCMP3373.AAC.1
MFSPRGSVPKPWGGTQGRAPHPFARKDPNCVGSDNNPSAIGLFKHINTETENEIPFPHEHERILEIIKKTHIVVDRDRESNGAAAESVAIVVVVMVVVKAVNRRWM